MFHIIHRTHPNHHLHISNLSLSKFTHPAPTLHSPMLHVNFWFFCLKFDEKILGLALGGPFKHVWMIMIDWNAQNSSDWKTILPLIFKFSRFNISGWLVFLMDQMFLVHHVYVFWMIIKSKIQVFFRRIKIFKARVLVLFVHWFIPISEPNWKLFEGIYRGYFTDHFSCWRFVLKLKELRVVGDGSWRSRIVWISVKVL